MFLRCFLGNILIQDKNDFSSLKLIDFGLSTKDPKKYQTAGTLIYMAPENFQQHNSGKPMDIWSIGIILYILLKDGKHPYMLKRESKKFFIRLMQNGSYSQMS